MTGIERTKTGIILFAHGARDPRWVLPFRKLEARLARLAPDTPVELAFLEIMKPDLPDAAARLAASGCTTICVVPAFLGQGGHVRDDVPALIGKVRAAHPGLDVRCAGAVGEDGGVIEAMAAYCVAQLPT